MQRHHRHPEAAPETCQGLRCQADLRHQQQRLATAGDHRLDQLQIDLGLAAAGDAVQQAGMKGIEAFVDRCQRLGLFAVER